MLTSVIARIKPAMPWFCICSRIRTACKAVSALWSGLPLGHSRKKSEQKTVAKPRKTRGITIRIAVAAGGEGFGAARGSPAVGGGTLIAASSIGSIPLAQVINVVNVVALALEEPQACRIAALDKGSHNGQALLVQEILGAADQLPADAAPLEV